MHFNLHSPKVDVYRYTFLRWHVEAFLRCEDDYVRDRLVTISLRAKLCLADFYALSANGPDRGRATGPRFRHRTLILSDPRIEGQSQLLSTRELPAYLARTQDKYALLGRAGSGKTALLLYLFFECLRPGSPLQQAGVVPCYVRSDIEQEKQGSSEVEDLIAASWHVHLEASKVRRNLTHWPRCLLLFDLRRKDAMGRSVMYRASQFGLRQSVAPPGHRVVVALRDSWPMAQQDARNRFKPLLMQNGWEPGPFLELLKGSLPPELWDRLVQLMEEHPTLSRVPLLWDLLVDLVYHWPEALERYWKTFEFFWIVTARILDQQRQSGWPHELALQPFWDPADPAWPVWAHPVDLLLQELSARMQRLPGSALPLAQVDQFGIRLADEVSRGLVEWWPDGCLDLLSGRPPSGLRGFVTDMPVFVVENGKLLWLHQRFCDAYFLRYQCYDRKRGYLVAPRPGQAVSEQA